MRNVTFWKKLKQATIHRKRRVWFPSAIPQQNLSEPDYRLGRIFRLLVPSATPGATFDFSAPLLWKRAFRLAVLAEFVRHQIDFRRLAGIRTLLSAYGCRLPGESAAVQ
jgi:hypothetical protein